MGDRSFYSKSRQLPLQVFSFFFVLGVWSSVKNKCSRIGENRTETTRSFQSEFATTAIGGDGDVCRFFQLSLLLPHQHDCRMNKWDATSLGRRLSYFYCSPPRSYIISFFSPNFPLSLGFFSFFFFYFASGSLSKFKYYYSSSSYSPVRSCSGFDFVISFSRIFFITRRADVAFVTKFLEVGQKNNKTGSCRVAWNICREKRKL